MLQYLDFSQASTSRKWTHKRQGDGFEAPRNSLEFPMEASHSYGVFQEDVPYSCHLRQYPKAGLNSSSAPIKKLIHEDMSIANESHKKPSVIARLMGMDTLPPVAASSALTEFTGHSDERKEEVTRPTPRRDVAEVVSTKHISFVQHKDTHKYASKQEIHVYNDEPSTKTGWAKLQPREHPQEEELQRFKKEFEAWQAARLWEHSRSLELESHVDDKCTAILPYRHQHKRKDAKHLEFDDDMHWRRSKDGGASISGSQTFSQLPVSRFYRDEERPLSPTRIVILKPCPEMSTDDIEESSVASPELVKKENNMEAFLEEVKKRLKTELEGRRASDDNADRWTPAGDVPADPKQIARNIANHIRDTVTKDLHPALVRSESTRSYRRDVPMNGQGGQTDYICRDARRQLSDRLKNVLRREPDTELPFTHRRRTASSSFEEETMPKVRHGMARKAKIRSNEEKKYAIESDVRSFRHEYKPSSPVDSEAVSPRNLIRSFSAPVSGTTFVKLLSEEPRVLTGARLQRKHEGSGSRPSAEERRGRKDAFSIKGRVSNLRQNLGLRAKLFGKKFHSADESFPDELPPIGTLVTAPSVLIHPGFLQENSTEVPPSPASWCSSPPDEMSRGGYPSPVSPLEASFSEHRSSSQAFKETSSSASEPGNSSEQAQTGELAEAKPETNPVQDDTAETESPEKAYVRAVFVNAGLHNQFSNWDVKPIPKQVYDEVEERSASSSQLDTAAVADHRLLFDLINEALPRAIKASTMLCTFKKWFVGPRRAPNAKKLLDGVWSSVQTSLQEPPRDASASSMDGLIALDLSASPWHGAFHDDMDALGAEVEAEILEELVDETVWDVLFNVGD